MYVRFVRTPTPQHNRTRYSIFVVEFRVLSEDAKAAELLPPVALQILCNLGFVLNPLLELEDKVVFACLI